MEAKVEVRAKPGGDCVQNPSDPDATYDGHKGKGYKAQLVETCSQENEVQLILTALPQTAAEPDADAVKPVLEDLKAKGWLPDTMLADTSYGGDDNVQAATDAGVELVSPVAGRAPEALPTPSPPNDEVSASVAMEPLTIDDFGVDERTGTVTSCPCLAASRCGRLTTTTRRQRPSRCRSGHVDRVHFAERVQSKRNRVVSPR